MDYNKRAEENTLSPLAQRNEYCIRKYSFKAPDIRSEFQRDYDRIVHCKAFRRMVDKAQIFSSVKGDHYRTRMTHTLIVNQIARSISDELHLNTPLAEAIAIGHDLGHTPFGHQGERTLHCILTGKPGYEVPNLGIKTASAEVFPYGGFKHNYQSVRVASILESQYLDVDGLDLSLQTLNGMWMHTSLKKGLDICDFSNGFLKEEGNCAFSLEGQVVAVADEIAQRSHDIDDAFASNLITPDGFLDSLSKSMIPNDDLKRLIEELFKKREFLKTGKLQYPDADEVFCAEISSIIVHYFIKDVCSESSKNMKEYDLDSFNSKGHKVHQKIICFSDNGQQICEYLENIITRKVINSREVALFDQNGSNIVLALFRAYYKNPMLLHSGTLNRILIEYQMHGFLKSSGDDSTPFVSHTEWDMITQEELSEAALKEGNADHQRLQKRCILVRAICDFISGMTDNYAKNEYKKIVL